MNEAPEASDHPNTSINKWVKQFRVQALGATDTVSGLKRLWQRV